MSNLITADKNIDRLLSIFMNGYNRVMGSLEPIHQKKLHPYVPALFRRWYHSALIEDTALSPANLIHYYFHHNCQETATIVLRPGKTRPLTTGDLVHFTLEHTRHPILADLQAFLQTCFPALLLTEENTLCLRDQKRLSARLFAKEPFYTTYLLHLSIRLGLLAKMPSLYANCVQPAAKWPDFFEQPPEKQLQDISKAMLAVAEEKLSEEFDSMDFCITEEDLNRYVCEYQSIDEIFAELYHAVGLEEDLLTAAMEEEDLSYEDSCLLSTTFYLGYLLDQWLLTPFSSYLLAIEPIYFTQFHFEREINQLCQCIIEGGDVDSELFFPYSLYRKTPFGRTLFCIDGQEENPFAMHGSMPFSCLLDSICSQLHVEEEEILSEPHLGVIYALKIKYYDDKRCWKMIELCEHTTLSVLSAELNGFFRLPEDTYTFLHSRQNLSEKLPVFGQKAVLKQFFKEKGDKLYYRLKDQKILFEIEIAAVGQKRPYLFYPRIIKQSKRMLHLENDM